MVQAKVSSHCSSLVHDAVETQPRPTSHVSPMSQRSSMASCRQVMSTRQLSSVQAWPSSQSRSVVQVPAPPSPLGEPPAQAVATSASDARRGLSQVRVGLE